MSSKQKTVAPYGSWSSPISADIAVQATASLSQIETASGDVLWCERRPAEGRRVIVCWSESDGIQDLLRSPYSCETSVYEYGGASYVVSDKELYFSNALDQRIYRLNSGDSPFPITPDYKASNTTRQYGDLVVTRDGKWVIAIRETQDGQTVQSDIVAVAAAGGGEPRTLIQGSDFFAAPRISPNGQRLCWLSWNLPLMPWNGTELWVADLCGTTICNPRQVAGGPNESISQPRWSPNGFLYFVSDRSGYWNLYVEDTSLRPVAPMAADFTNADWMLGQSTYAFMPDGHIIAKLWRNGTPELALIDPSSDTVTSIDTPYATFSSIKALGSGIVCFASSATQEAAVVALRSTGGAGTVLRAPRKLPFDNEYLSIPRIVEFDSEDNRKGHAIFYQPTNSEFCGPENELPPLISMTHGGPTHLAVPVLSTPEEGEDAQGLAIHFWTSRGFAVVDVNYCGSTGFGKAFRDSLKGHWGVADVADCVNAARYLVREAQVDVGKLFIRGGSAGGFVALCALLFHKLYAAGASYFGVTDLELLATSTHKFESRYFDWLIGPLPAARDVYKQRSPITHADSLQVPLIIFQGMEDRIVPPAQSRLLASILEAKGLPYVYKTFESEGHGFRNPSVLSEALEAELSFYRQALHLSSCNDLSRHDAKEPDASEEQDSLTYAGIWRSGSD